jgi:hypothetical protein
MINEEIAPGMVCFFHQKKHFYLIIFVYKLLYHHRSLENMNIELLIKTGLHHTPTI